MRPGADIEFIIFAKRNHHLQREIILGNHQTPHKPHHQLSQLHRTTVEDIGEARSNTEIQHQRCVVGIEIE